jgi:hypothetical protein
VGLNVLTDGGLKLWYFGHQLVGDHFILHWHPGILPHGRFPPATVVPNRPTHPVYGGALRLRNLTPAVLPFDGLSFTRQTTAGPVGKANEPDGTLALTGSRNARSPRLWGPEVDHGGRDWAEQRPGGLLTVRSRVVPAHLGINPGVAAAAWTCVGFGACRVLGIGGVGIESIRGASHVGARRVLVTGGVVDPWGDNASV